MAEIRYGSMASVSDVRAGAILPIDPLSLS